MTILMDKFFTTVGLEEDEIKACRIRNLIYIGMVFMAGVTTAFSVMAILGG